MDKKNVNPNDQKPAPVEETNQIQEIRNKQNRGEQLTSDEQSELTKADEAR